MERLTAELAAANERVAKAEADARVAQATAEGAQRLLLVLLRAAQQHPVAAAAKPGQQVAAEGPRPAVQQAVTYMVGPQHMIRVPSPLGQQQQRQLPAGGAAPPVVQGPHLQAARPVLAVAGAGLLPPPTHFGQPATGGQKAAVPWGQIAVPGAHAGQGPMMHLPAAGQQHGATRALPTFPHPALHHPQPLFALHPIQQQQPLLVVSQPQQQQQGIQQHHLPQHPTATLPTASSELPQQLWQASPQQPVSTPHPAPQPEAAQLPTTMT